MSKKQSIFPVAFLTESSDFRSEPRPVVSSTKLPPRDHRCAYVEDAIQFLMDENLSGVIFEADTMLRLEDAELSKMVSNLVSSNRFVASYGRLNSEKHAVERQLGAGIYKIITDGLTSIRSLFDP